MRIGLLVMFTIFTVFHGGFSDALMPLIIVSGSSYLLFNLLSFYWIRLSPYALMRIVMMPVFDCYLIVLVMLGDGGQMSVVYFLLLSPIIGNGQRYGSKMLLYSQCLGLIAMVSISVLTVSMLNQPIDWVGLSTQIFAIFYISSYAYGIIRRIEGTVQEKQAAEVSASRLIAEAPHPACTFDLQADDAPVIYANPAMATLTTSQPGSLAGTPIDQLVIPEDRDALRLAIGRQHHSPAMAQCYVRIPDSKGRPLQIHCEIRRTLQEGKQIGLCYLTDISESERFQRELAEAQKQSQTAALAAGVAHDFRNLLSAIIGHAELISMEHDHPQLQKDIQQIIKAGNRGSEMVEQLLQLGRSKQSDFKVLDIAGSICDMVQLARVQLPPDIDLTIHVDKKLPKVRVNLAQIEQVILNLVSNAAHAMPEQKGKITIRLSHIRSDARNSGLSIVLRDNGCGIEPEYIQFSSHSGAPEKIAAAPGWDWLWCSALFAGTKGALMLNRCRIVAQYSIFSCRNAAGTSRLKMTLLRKNSQKNRMASRRTMHRLCLWIMKVCSRGISCWLMINRKCSTSTNYFYLKWGIGYKQPVMVNLPMRCCRKMALNLIWF